MKYGQTLKQRSILEWGHYNLDYNEVKHLIKEHTSPGKGKAVSIPGQGRETERDFDAQLLDVLRDQFTRIELFIKSKTGEIERRLDHLSKQIRIFRNQLPPRQPDNIPIRRLERYARIESDILRSGEEIKSLSRFVGAQKLGFTKLLKKHRKWTGPTEVTETFNAEVQDESIPFSRYNLDALMNHWSEVLHAFRAPFQAISSQSLAVNRFSRAGEPVKGNTSSATIAHRFEYASTSPSVVDYDSAFFTLPIGDAGARAVYWIHPEQIVEITVLLLQYMKLLAASDGAANHRVHQGSQSSTMSLSRCNSLANALSQLELELDTGLAVLDNDEEFAERQSSNAYTEVQNPATNSKAPVGRIRWTTNSEAVMVLKEGQQEATEAVCGYQATRLKRKHLLHYLDINHSLRRLSVATLQHSDPLEAAQRSEERLLETRAWMEKHDNVRLLAVVASKRMRFSGLANDDSRGQWVILDQNIYLSKATPSQLSGNEWPSACRNMGTRFPYAVLQVRQEGPWAMDLIDMLDRSYLTERIRGFSLETQAVWSCCKPRSMEPPFWLPILGRDIRKLPNKEAPQKHPSIVAFPRSESSRRTSVASVNLSSSVGEPPEPSPATSINQSTSDTTAIASKVGPSEKRSAISRSKRARVNTPDYSAEPTRQGYWNEYDFPEEGEHNDDYIIYVDPDAAVGYPGQEVVHAIIGWLGHLFRGPTPEEQRPLLSSASPIKSCPNDGAADSQSSSDEAEATHALPTRSTYGSINSGRRSQRSSHVLPSQNPSFSFLSFLSTLNPFATDRKTRANRRKSSGQTRRATTLNTSIDPITAELRHRFRERESSKLRTCFSSLSASVAILVASWVLAATGRRKQVGIVDEGVLFGVVVSLLFATVGVGYLFSLSPKDFDGRADTRRLAGMWMIRGVVGVFFVGICVACGRLIAWMAA